MGGSIYEKKDLTFFLPQGRGGSYILNKESFREIFARDGQEIQLCHKIKDLHLEQAKGWQRQRVFAALHSFSPTQGQKLLCTTVKMFLAKQFKQLTDGLAQ